MFDHTRTYALLKTQGLEKCNEALESSVSMASADATLAEAKREVPGSGGDSFQLGERAHARRARRWTAAATP